MLGLNALPVRMSDSALGCGLGFVELAGMSLSRSDVSRISAGVESSFTLTKT